MSMSMFVSFGDERILSDDTAVLGSRDTVLAKFPVWNLLRFRRRSPLEDLGSEVEGFVSLVLFVWWLWLFRTFGVVLQYM